MSEVETQETQEKAPPESPALEKPNGETDGKEFVEFKDPETEARFKRVYGNMKQWERVAERLGQDNKALLERLEKVEVGQSKTDTDRQLSDLKAARKQAYEAGDFDKINEIDDRIVDLKISRKAAPEPKKEESKPGLSPEDQGRMNAWASEESDGEKIRPWATPGHPDHSKAMRVATTVLQDPELSYAPMDDVLKEIDRLMGVKTEKPRARTATVLSSDPPRRSGKEEMKLNEDEKLVAKKMGMTAEQYAKARKTWAA